MTQPRSTAGSTVLIGDDFSDIEAIQGAIRDRVARRDLDRVPIDPAAVSRLEEERLSLLDAWNLPRPVWQAMWPPNLEPWNLDEAFPIRSHRAGLGAVLVVVKRLARWLLGALARPLLSQQVEINRALALMARQLASEVAVERVRSRALEQRLLRIAAAMAERRADTPPLVSFTNPDA